jgi:hypothetical protein
MMANSGLKPERFAQSTNLIMSALTRLANRERVERTKKGARKPKRTPWLVGEPPFVRFFDALENAKDPFSELLDHEQISANEESLKMLLDPKKHGVSKTFFYF